MVGRDLTSKIFDINTRNDGFGQGISFKNPEISGNWNWIEDFFQTAILILNCSRQAARKFQRAI